jgi:hypothetical protein
MPVDLAICLGVIVVLVIIIVVLLGRAHQERFTLVTPASPLQNRRLKKLVASMRDTAASADGNPARRRIASSLSRSAQSFEATPPTYANYLNIYHGMTRSLPLLHRVANENAKSTAAKTFSHKIIGVVHDVHGLGVALDVE